jgi:hypothetical protein
LSIKHFQSVDLGFGLGSVQAYDDRSSDDDDDDMAAILAATTTMTVAIVITIGIGIGFSFVYPLILLISFQICKRLYLRRGLDYSIHSFLNTIRTAYAIGIYLKIPASPTTLN